MAVVPDGRAIEPMPMPISACHQFRLGCLVYIQGQVRAKKQFILLGSELLLGGHIDPHRTSVLGSVPRICERLFSHGVQFVGGVASQVCADARNATWGHTEGSNPQANQHSCRFRDSG